MHNPPKQGKSLRLCFAAMCKHISRCPMEMAEHLWARPTRSGQYWGHFSTPKRLNVCTTFIPGSCNPLVDAIEGKSHTTYSSIHFEKWASLQPMKYQRLCSISGSCHYIHVNLLGRCHASNREYSAIHAFYTLMYPPNSQLAGTLDG